MHRNAFCKAAAEQRGILLGIVCAAIYQVDVVVVPWLGRVRTGKFSLALYRGTHHKMSDVAQARGRSVITETSEQCYLEIDGEDMGWLPAVFDVVPQTLLMTGVA